MEYIVLGVEGLNFLIYNDKEYLNIQCEDFSENLDFYFHTILREMDEQKESYETICQNLLEALIIQLSRHTGSPRRNASFLKKRLPANAVTQSASSILTSEKNITLDTLAELTHLNKYYFAHTFTEIYGIAPMNYLAQKRIFTSQELLTSTDLNQAAIAKQCGFSSSSYFSQCFRKICGMTPTAYRKQFIR